MQREIVTWRFEMASASELRPASVQPLVLERSAVPLPELNRFFYSEVGKACIWWERLDWTDERWTSHVTQEQLQTWIAYLDGTPCGFFELMEHPNKEFEIVLFGLLSPFVGRGLGGHFLTQTTKLIWNMDARLIWLKTSTLDNPRAIPNYEARGFTKVAEERTTSKLPEQVVIRLQQTAIEPLLPVAVG